MRTLGVICARAGSKTLPGKNIIPFNGVPLVIRTVRTALRAIELNDVVVSTDCRLVERLADGLVKVVQRPPELAQDTSPIHEAVLHALMEMEQEYDKDTEDLMTYDMVVCLQNSSPLRTPEEIDESIFMLRTRPEIDTVMSVVNNPHYHPALGYTTNTIGKLIRLKSFDGENADPDYRRQDREPIYFMAGNVFAMRRDSFVESPYVPCGKIFPMEIPEHRAIDIHNWRDWRIAEEVAKLHE